MHCSLTLATVQNKRFANEAQKYIAEQIYKGFVIQEILIRYSSLTNNSFHAVFTLALLYDSRLWFY